MRKHPLITGQYYHIYNRGVDKRDIFMNKEDLLRFILSVREFNIVTPVGSIRDKTKYSPEVKPLIDGGPLVSIVCYCFNPNHFHFIVKQEIDGGISEFFKRLLGGYTMYFNEIHKRSGSLFQGTFKSHLLEKDGYVFKIWPYVNMNYMVHDIPLEKNQLVFASDKEYENMNFDLVSEIEAKNLLGFYGDNNLNFKKECLSVIDMIRNERGLTSLLDEDLLP